MIPAADFTQSSLANEPLDKLTHIASSLGVELIDLASAMNQIDTSTHAQLKYLDQLRGYAKGVLDGNASVRAAIETINKTTVDTLDAVVTSVETIQSAGNRTQELASWVQSLDERITVIEETIRSAQSNNDEIASIAAQVNILAINAKIVAASAGEAGRGFAVIAEAINELAHKTTGAAQGNNDSITTLGDWIVTIRSEATDASSNAKGVLSEADDTNTALSGIADYVRLIDTEAKQIKTNADNVGTAIVDFGTNFEHMGQSLEQTANGIHLVRGRATTMVSQSESLIQSSVALGGVTEDTRFINEVQNRAALTSAAFENAISSGLISAADLFTQKYTPVENSDPPQVMASFTALTDRLLPEIQEPALDFDPCIVFCAAINKNGYIPTHNKKFSQPMRNDPVWNMANSRNRRIFDDSVGLKAANNKEPFLLQIYHRDMGGGNVTVMKDISAPIIVNGRLWGGLRLAYISE